MYVTFEKDFLFADGFKTRPLYFYLGGINLEYINNLSENLLKVSTDFIDKYMPSADGTFVKVYLLGLRQCSEGLTLTPKGIAAFLNILESDVLRAWKYWEDVGIVRCSQDQKGNFTVTFLDPSPKNNIGTPTLAPKKPSYSSSEISGYISDHEEMRELLRHAEVTLNKPLSSNDQSTIFSFHDWLGLPVDVIAMLISYNASIGKKSMRAIELMAITWSENQIDTTEKAEKYLTQLTESNSKINSFKRAIGIFDRVLTKAEADYLSEWAHKLGSPVELIKLAAEITALNTGKISLPYMNTMLQEWYRKGIKSAADARAMRAEFKKQSGEIVKASANSKGGKFGDYSCKTTYDFNAIENAALNFKKTSPSGDES